MTAVATTVPAVDRQPRERPVPCWQCGWVPQRGGGVRPVRETYNDNALCDEHQPTRETQDNG